MSIRCEVIWHPVGHFVVWIGTRYSRYCSTSWLWNPRVTRVRSLGDMTAETVKNSCQACLMFSDLPFHILKSFVAHIWYMFMYSTSARDFEWLRTECYAAVRAALEAELASRHPCLQVRKTQEDILTSTILLPDLKILVAYGFRLPAVLPRSSFLFQAGVRHIDTAEDLRRV